LKIRRHCGAQICSRMHCSTYGCLFPALQLSLWQQSLHRWHPDGRLLPCRAIKAYLFVCSCVLCIAAAQHDSSAKQPHAVLGGLAHMDTWIQVTSTQYHLRALQRTAYRLQGMVHRASSCGTHQQQPPPRSLPSCCGALLQP
jgi:hypothetical protein